MIIKEDQAVYLEILLSVPRKYFINIKKAADMIFNIDLPLEEEISLFRMHVANLGTYLPLLNIIV